MYEAREDGTTLTKTKENDKVAPTKRIFSESLSQ